MKPKMFVAFVVAVGLLSSGAQSASAAGSYDVASCDAAGGPNRAWRPESHNMQLFVSRDWCPALGQAGGFGVRSTVMRLKAAQLSSAWWRFDAPEGTSISNFEWAGRQLTAAPGWATRIQTNLSTLSGCGPSLKPCAKEWVRGDSPDTYAAGGASWIRVGAVCLAIGGCQTSVKSGVAAVDAVTSFSRVRVVDPGLPRVSVSGAGWVDGWVGGDAQLLVDASDASGISELRLEVDGRAVERKRFTCDFTRPRPCSDRTAAFNVPAGQLADGSHHISVVALDAADNIATAVRDISFDSHPPAAVAAPKVLQGAGWQATRHFDISWTLPATVGGAPVAATLVKVCSSGSAEPLCLPVTRVSATSDDQGSAGVDLPFAGEWTARVSHSDKANPEIFGSESAASIMRFDPTVPGLGSISVPQGWLTREAVRVAHASVSLVDGLEPPVSGIGAWSVSLGGTPATQPEFFGSSVSVPLAGVGEGVTTISARAFTGAGVGARAVAVAQVKVDGSPPTVSLQDPGASGWVRGPVGLSARGNDQPGLSGMRSAPEDGGEGGADAGMSLFVDGQEVARASGEDISGEVSVDGVHRVWATGRDAAGNSSATSPVLVRIDSTPPERLAFLPQDAATPNIVRVDAGDFGSGLKSVGIQIRPISGGAWTNLETGLSDGRAEALIDDEKLAAGLWEMRAVALDNADNQTVTSRTVGGDPAVLTLPLRSTTRLSGGLSLQPAVGTTAAAAGSMRAPNGAVTYAAGLLEDSDGAGVARGLIHVASRPLMPGAQWAEEGNVFTDRAGRFSVRLNPGPSRVLRLWFDGNRSALATEQQMNLRVASHSSISVNPKIVRTGRSVMFRGHLSGDWLPAGGKIVMVQAWLRNVGWQTFAAVRANQDGDWSAPYRFRATVGRVTYQIRAVIPSEAAYPFEGSETGVIKVTAVG